MKTYNNHPLWYNEPLRLTSHQTQNPNVVLDDFFECYHLNEVRELMWTWVVEAVSSPHSNANDHHERNNYMYFYEKIESLVEAAWIMNRGTIKNAKHAPGKEQEERVETNGKACQRARFYKPARLIEKVAEQPTEVITEVFTLTPFNEMQEYLLPTWLRVAVINTESPYSADKGRETLYEFYDQLLLFVEALYVISEGSADYKPTSLNAGQLADPTLVITTFFQQFSIDYIRRELCDFLDAGIGYEGNYPNGFTPWQAWMTYNHLQCLTEAAYLRYVNQQMQSVTNVLSQQTVELEEVG
jgi:hypothetical protein